MLEFYDEKTITRELIDMHIDQFRQFMHTYLNMQFQLEQDMRYGLNSNSDEWQQRMEGLKAAQDLLDELYRRVLIQGERQLARRIRERGIPQR